MSRVRRVSVDVSDVDLTRPDGRSSSLGVSPEVQVVVLMRHRH